MGFDIFDHIPSTHVMLPTLIMLHDPGVREGDVTCNKHKISLVPHHKEIGRSLSGFMPVKNVFQ